MILSCLGSVAPRAQPSKPDRGLSTMQSTLTGVGFVIAVLAVVYGVFIILCTIILSNPVPGYPSLLVVVLFLGGVQLITLGVIGEYIGRIFNETKERPLYLVSETLLTSQPQDHVDPV